MPPFITSLLTSILTGAMGGGIAGFGGTRNARAQAMQDENVRNDLTQRAEDMMNPDYSRLIEGMSRQLTRSLQSQGAAAGQQGLMTSSRAGTLSSGATKSRENQMSAEMSAALAAAIMQDMLQRETAAAQLMQNPAMRTPSPDSFNLGLDTFLGFLGGGAGGAGNTISEAIRGGYLRQNNDEQPDSQVTRLMSGGYNSGGMRGMNMGNNFDVQSGFSPDFLNSLLFHSVPPQPNFQPVGRRGTNF